MRARSRQTGYTIVELMVAVFLAFIVLLALGRIILANQRSWEWGRDKAVLQANATEALESMSRSIHAARRLQYVSASEFRTYDETGALVHTYRKVGTGESARLQADGTPLVDRPCTGFVVTLIGDTTSLTLDLELAIYSNGRVLSSVRGTTRAAVRNRFFEY